MVRAGGPSTVCSGPRRGTWEPIVPCHDHRAPRNNPAAIPDTSGDMRNEDALCRYRSQYVAPTEFLWTHVPPPTRRQRSCNTGAMPRTRRRQRRHGGRATPMPSCCAASRPAARWSTSRYPAGHWREPARQRRAGISCDGVAITGSASAVCMAAARRSTRRSTWCRHAVPHRHALAALPLKGWWRRRRPAARCARNPTGAREIGIGASLEIAEAGQWPRSLSPSRASSDAITVHLDEGRNARPGTTVLSTNAWSPVQAAESTRPAAAALGHAVPSRICVPRNRRRLPPPWRHPGSSRPVCRRVQQAAASPGFLRMRCTPTLPRLLVRKYGLTKASSTWRCGPANCATGSTRRCSCFRSARGPRIDAQISVARISPRTGNCRYRASRDLRILRRQRPLQDPASPPYHQRARFAAPPVQFPRLAAAG